jgi:hypothetical protein
MKNFLDQQIIFENVTGFESGYGYIPLMKPTADGFIVPIMSCDFQQNDPAFKKSACAVKVKM